MKKLIENNLELAYSAITGFEFAHVKADFYLEKALENASLYIICQRPIITFENFFIYEDYLYFEIHQRGNKNILKGSLSVLQNELGLSKEGYIKIALNFIDKENVKKSQPFYDLYGFTIVNEFLSKEKTTIWFSPEKLLFNWWRKRIKCEIEGDYKSFLSYKVHYVGKATKQSILKRLTGHSTFQDILSIENSITYKDLPKHEISILCFKFSDNVEISIFGEDSKTDDMVKSLTGENYPNHEKISLDAEKALIQAMRPNYNRELFKNYPKSKDGLYSHKYDYISYSFIDPIKLIYSEGEICGENDFNGGDRIEITNNTNFALIKK